MVTCRHYQTGILMHATFDPSNGAAPFRNPTRQDQATGDDRFSPDANTQSAHPHRSFRPGHSLVIGHWTLDICCWPLAILLSFSLCASSFADSVVVFNEIMYHPQTNEPSLE